VHGSEHFNDAIGTVQCAAAPIRDIHSQLVGVLNISIEGRPFGFDAFALIGTYAGMIENHLVTWQSRDMLVLAFQVDPRLLGTPQAARIVVDHDGRLKWLNDIAARLTAGSVGQPVEGLLGRSLDALLSAVREDQPHRLCLPNGLHVWMLARRRPEDRPAVLWTAAAGANAASPPRPATDEVWRAMRHWTPVEQRTDLAARSAETLQESQNERIARALEACGGKVARAARMLGVSRGVVYRHLRKPRT
jgi:transcriptional regulator of acetoin/glycerol metabolism